MTSQQTNPVRHISYWVKGEVLSLESLIAAINYKDNVEMLKKKCGSEINELTADIQKLNSGKFTFGGILKNDA